MENQPCQVCHQPAAGFHFGAFTCEGCKSFFGRSKNNQAVIGECKNNYRCVVDKKNRTSCKACRLRKCLMVGMSKSGSRYGRRSNWFKIHCLMQANGNKRGLSGPTVAPQPQHQPQPPPGLLSPSVGKLAGPENQLPPTLAWPPRLSVPPPLHSYANMLRQADTKMERKEEDVVDVTDIISVSRSPSPLNISSISETSSKSSQSLPEETRRNNNNQPGPADLPKFPPGPLFPFAGLGGLGGLAGPSHLPALSSLYNPLPFSSPLYRLR